MARILVVEDEVDLNNLLRTEIEAEGHTVLQVFDGPGALVAVEEYQPHLVILDWMLPGLDGLTVCRRIRLKHIVPIIMLTARNEEVDRILGLEIGADDYMSKPFSIRELMARVRAMLRRIEFSNRSLQSPVQSDERQPVASAITSGSYPLAPAPALLIRGLLTINIVEHTVQLATTPIELTPKEYDLLVLLASHPGRTFSREFLLQRLWGNDYDGFDRTVDTHITRLRKKLGSLGEKIMTVWGVGYRFIM